MLILAGGNYISSIKRSSYVIDYDYNAPDAEHLQKTYYDFYKIIRDKNPSTPLVKNGEFVLWMVVILPI